MCTLQGSLISCITDKPLGTSTAEGDRVIIIVSVDKAHNFYLRIRCSKSPRQRAGQGLCLGPWQEETILRQRCVKVGGFLSLSTLEGRGGCCGRTLKMGLMFILKAACLSFPFALQEVPCAKKWRNREAQNTKRNRTENTH